MLSCWRSEPQVRLSFPQLQYSFKSIIAADNPDTSYITVQPSVCFDSIMVSDHEPVSSNSQNLAPEVGYERLSAAM